MSEIYGESLTFSGGSNVFAYIVVTYPEGATCTCAKGSKTYTARDTSGIYVFGVDSAGDWVVTASDSGHTNSVTVSITAQYQTMSETIIFHPEWYNTLKNISVGQTVTIDDKIWLLVNKTSSAAVLGLNTIYSTGKFGDSQTYKGSTIASVAANFESSQLSSKTKQYLNTVEVYDVFAKVFVPTYSQINGDLSYYINDSRRQCTYGGEQYGFWTSSPYSWDNRYVYYTMWDGSIKYGSAGTYGIGFRPHMEVNLTL